MGSRRGRSVVLALGVVAFLFSCVSGGFACEAGTSLNLSVIRGPAGTRVDVTGGAYSIKAPVPPVVLRWNGTEGPELARATPDAAGRIAVAITVPDELPGYYVVIAVQRDDKGVARPGTPSRASFQIVGPAESTTTPTTRRPATTTTAVVRATTTSTATSTTSTTSATSTTTSTTPAAAPAVVVPVQPVADRSEEIPVALAALSVALVSAVAVAVGRQARSR